VISLGKDSIVRFLLAADTKFTRLLTAKIRFWVAANRKMRRHVGF
jgi:hypothetical protein